MGTRSGRGLLTASLKESMPRTGWRPRAAGWFTLDRAAPWTAVAAVGTAVEGMPAGQALATLYVGARHEVIEAQVAALMDSRPSYQLRTVIERLGYLMPQHSDVQWLVTPDTVDQVADELTRAVDAWGLAWVDDLAADPDKILAATAVSWLGGLDRMVRHLVATQLWRDRQAIEELVGHARASVGTGTGTYAQLQGTLLDRFVARRS